MDCVWHCWPTRREWFLLQHLRPFAYLSSALRLISILLTTALLCIVSVNTQASTHLQQCNTFGVVRLNNKTHVTAALALCNTENGETGRTSECFSLGKVYLTCVLIRVDGMA